MFARFFYTFVHFFTTYETFLDSSQHLLKLFCHPDMAQ